MVTFNGLASKSQRLALGSFHAPLLTAAPWASETQALVECELAWVSIQGSKEPLKGPGAVCLGASPPVLHMRAHHVPRSLVLHSSKPLTSYAITNAVNRLLPWASEANYSHTRMSSTPLGAEAAHAARIGPYSCSKSSDFRVAGQKHATCCIGVICKHDIAGRERAFGKIRHAG